MSFNVRDYAYRLTGVDLFRVKGFNSQTVLQIISEVGVDLSGFASREAVCELAERESEQ